MPRKSIKQVWYPSEGRVLIHDGTVTSSSQHLSETFLKIKEKAIELEKLYNSYSLKIPPDCDLSLLINDAKKLSDCWLLNQTEDMSPLSLFRVMHLNQIANAVLPLQLETNPIKYLKSIISGNLDLSDRKKSNAKNVLWELKVWSTLKKKSFNAKLQDPPDIVVSFKETKIGIACKKLYSEKHVQNVLSEAVKQIESGFDYGIVAINLDDLMPANKILSAQTVQAAVEFISRKNERFIKSHERHLKKYLSSGRIISALVSTSLLTDVNHGTPRLNFAQQDTFWTIPSLTADKKEKVDDFYNYLFD